MKLKKESMKFFMNTVKIDAQKRKLTLEYIGDRVGRTKGAISKYFSGKDRVDFVDLIKILEVVYEGEDIKGKLKEFFKYDTRQSSIRESFEWCANTGNTELLKYLISIHENSGIIDRTLVELYGLLILRNENKVIPDVFHHQLDILKIRGTLKEKKRKRKKRNEIIEEEKEETKVKTTITIETELLLKIATIYAYSDLLSYDLVVKVSSHLEEYLNFSSNGYLKESYKFRMIETNISSLLSLNKVQEAFELAESTLKTIKPNNYPLIYSSILCMMGEMNITKNYKLSIEYITKAIRTLKDLSLTTHVKRKLTLESTHDFIKLINNDFEGLYLTSKAEMAHFHAKQGNTEKALSLLNELEKENGQLTVFQEYYKSIALNDKELKNRAAQKLKLKGNYFYSNLIDSN